MGAALIVLMRQPSYTLLQALDHGLGVANRLDRLLFPSIANVSESTLEVESLARV